MQKPDTEAGLYPESKRGRKPRVSKAAEISRDINEKSVELKLVLSSMSDIERSLFLALSSGLTPGQTAIKTANHHWFSALCTHVQILVKEHNKNEDGRHEHVERYRTKGSSLLTLSDWKYIHPADREKIDGIVRPRIKSYLKGLDLESYQLDLTQTFKIAAPEAFGVISELMHDRDAPHAVRLRAAQDTLDRSGYIHKEQKVNDMPINLFIDMSGEAKAEKKSNVTYVEEDGSVSFK